MTIKNCSAEMSKSRAGFVIFLIIALTFSEACDRGGALLIEKQTRSANDSIQFLRTEIEKHPQLNHIIVALHTKQPLGIILAGRVGSSEDLTTLTNLVKRMPNKVPIYWLVGVNGSIPTTDEKK